MHIIEILLKIIITIILMAVVGLCLAAVTGHERRAYPVNSPTDNIQIGNKNYKIGEAAEEYAPYMHLRRSTPSPDLLLIRYESVQSPQTVDFVYYLEWEDEIHPNPFFHKVYRFFRAAYYGYPVRDIEFFQIKVSLETGQILELLFETSPNNDYYPVVSEHLTTRFTKRGNNLFDSVQSQKSGKEWSRQENVKLLFEGNHTLILAQTWNHLTRNLSEEDSDFDRFLTDVKPLSEAEYADGKYCRKSQGDHRTQENPVSRFMSLLAFFSLLPLVIYSIFIKRWKFKK